MRISDWSSDVCSSDLLQAVTAQSTYTNENVLKLNNLVQNQLLQGGMNMFDSFAKGLAGLATGTMSVGEAFNGDRQSVVSGKSVSVRVDFGGRRIIKKKIKKQTTESTQNTQKTN